MFRSDTKRFETDPLPLVQEHIDMSIYSKRASTANSTQRSYSPKRPKSTDQILKSKVKGFSFNNVNCSLDGNDETLPSLLERHKEILNVRREIIIHSILALTFVSYIII